jgi:para-nitrobenzyl esterase
MTAVVETGFGKVEGIDSGGVLQFRGIPYAAGPVGDLRWRPPQPPAPWAGVRRATEFGPAAPQLPGRLQFLPAQAELTTDEAACLSLNVYTSSISGPSRPVLVWVHGGGFTGGSSQSPWYNGMSFARQGVVVVTLNYRLGALGFLHLGDDFPGSGNCGVLDQAAALGWVRDNIAAFGGDPGRVTVFGESAGAMSVGTLMAMPAAAGTFQSAVLQSGAASTVYDVAHAEAVAAAMAARLGGRDALLTVPVDQILAAQADVMAGRAGEVFDGPPFRPVVDSGSLPDSPLTAVRDGRAAGVKVLAGTNRDEMSLFFAGQQGWREVTEEQVVRRVDRAVPGRGRELYDAYLEQLPGASPTHVWVAIESDRVFRAPAIELTEAQLRHTADAWMYLFTWESPLLDGALGSCHALELPFVWNTLSDGAAGFTGGGPEAQGLADEMHAAWTAFASTGDPGWARYDAGRRVTRVFGPGPEVEGDPMGAARRLWPAGV